MKSSTIIMMVLVLVGYTWFLSSQSSEVDIDSSLSSESQTELMVSPSLSVKSTVAKGDVLFVAPHDVVTALASTVLVTYYDSTSTAKSLGTGWLADVSAYGLVGCYIVTNSHVINAEIPEVRRIGITIYKTQANGQSTQTHQAGQVVYDDKKADIAFVQLKSCQNLPRFKLAFDAQVNETVYALGNPHALSSTVTKGIVSHAKRYSATMNNSYVYVQTDAPINPGNSGGPLVDAQTFEIVGMNVMILPHSSGRDGMGFSVRSHTIAQAFKNFKALGHTSFPKFGFYPHTVNADLISALQLPLSIDCSGLFVSSVVKDGAVKKAGLKNGDIIQRINGRCINNIADLLSVITENNTVDTFTFNVLRPSKKEMLVFNIQADDVYKAPKNPRLDGKESERVYEGYLGFDTSIETSYPSDKLVVTKVYEFSEAFWAQALVNRVKKPIAGKIIDVDEPVLKNNLPYIGSDGKSLKSYQTVETVRDTHGRSLALITKESLANFARESALSKAKLVIGMRLHILKAENYFATQWKEISVTNRFVIFNPTPYVAP